MPRKGNAEALTSTDARNKAKASLKRRMSIKAIDRLADIELGPIDEELGKLRDKLAEIQAQIAKLENAKKIVLALRGSGDAGLPHDLSHNEGAQVANRVAASEGNGVAGHALPDPKTLRRQRATAQSEAANANPPELGGVDTRDLAERLARHLKVCQPQTAGELSDYFNVPRMELMKVLQADKRFLLGGKGWSLDI